MKRYVKTLSQHRLYDIVTALRGPDVVPDRVNNVLDTVKFHVTARLRTTLFSSASIRNAGGLVNDQPLVEADLDTIVRSLCAIPMKDRRHAGHYLDHLYQGVKASQDHPIWNHRVVPLLGIIQSRWAAQDLVLHP